MPELLLINKIIEPLNLPSIIQLKKEYLQHLAENPFPPLTGGDYRSVLHHLKRKSHKIGPYKDITIFEAANRIASDLTLMEGVIHLFKKSPSARVKLRLGTMQAKDKGDFTFFDNGKEFQGEAFDVAPSFFTSKLYKTLHKWEDREDIKYIVFNKNVLTDAKCDAYYQKKLTEYPHIVFYPVNSWHEAGANA
jgi:hypothetical protein